MPPRRVLVTGATGFIGMEVSRQFANAGVPMRLMVHRGHRARYVSDYSRDLVAADLLDSASLARAVAGIDTIIHLAGRATFEAYDVVRPTLVEGTATLAHLAMQAGVRQFVLASSTLVYPPSTVPVDAATSTGPLSGYGRAKAEAERALLRAASTGSMGVGILRLPHVYGSRDALFGTARRGWLVAPGPGDALVSHLHVHDAAQALTHAALEGWHGVAPIADEVPTTMRDFISRLAAALGGIRVLRVPERVARLGARATAAMARLRDQPTLETPDGVSGWNRPMLVTPGVTWGDLGVTPRFPSIVTGIPAAARESVPTHWVHPVHDRRGGAEVHRSRSRHDRSRSI